MEDDCVVRWLKEVGIPLTRRNYLNAAYLGTPPKELSAEEEAELPEQIQRADIFIDGEEQP